MKVRMHRWMAAPAMLLALAGNRILQQPVDHASAYSGGAATIYTAPVLTEGGATTATSGGASVSAAHVVVHAIAETADVPSLRSASLSVTASGHLAPAVGYSVVGGPTISPALIDKVLASYSSPMAGEGDQLYTLGVKYGIDPAFCLAFFIRESDAGTQGEAVLTHNLGNIRAEAGAPAMDGYRYYDTWLEGAEDWYRLIRDVYVRQWGLTTVTSILPVYAPSSDNNDPASYIHGVEQMVTAWRAEA